MKPYSPRLILFFTPLLLVAHCTTHEQRLKSIEGPPSFLSTIATAPTVAFCDLMRDPDSYDQQVIRTRAVFFRNLENQRLEDPACPNEAGYVWVEFTPSYVHTDEALKKKLHETVCAGAPCPAGRARVIVVGRFDGPSEGPYGHLDEYRFRFSVIRLEQVDQVEASLNQ